MATRKVYLVFKSTISAAPRRLYNYSFEGFSLALSKIRMLPYIMIRKTNRQNNRNDLK